MNQVMELDPSTYQRHAIHGEERTWSETNCYVDVLIELLHALGHEPNAALPFTLGVDFEGDQWTFFKFPHEDLFALYSIEIQEFNPWSSLLEHVDKQVEQGRPVLIEMDSYFLPDTAGTAYKINHEKSTIAVNAIDIDRQYLGYFHGASYYELQEEDFVDIFQLDGLVHERMLPPYLEYVKRRNLASPLQGASLLEASEDILRKHLKLIPQTNPFILFKKAFQKDFEWLLTQDIQTFHQYSFATLRQYGACFELVKTYIGWLQSQGRKGLENSMAAFSSISNMAKPFQFQLARAMARKRFMDLSPIDQMAESWQVGISELADRYG